MNLVKLDGNGSIHWESSFGGSKQDSPKGILQNEDDSFILFGTSVSDDGDIGGNYGSQDIILAKASASGQLITLQNIGGSGNEWSYSILRDISGDLLMNAVTNSIDHDVTGNVGCNGCSQNWLVRIEEIVE